MSHISRNAMLSVLAMGLCLTMVACAKNAPLVPPSGAGVKHVSLSDDQSAIDAETWEENGKIYIRGTLRLLQVEPGQYRGAKISAQFMKNGKKVDSAPLELSYNRNANLCEFQGELDPKTAYDDIHFRVFYSYRLD